MLFLQAADLGRDQAGAGLDPAMIAVDDRMAGRRLVAVVEVSANVRVQRRMVALERQGIIPALADDLPGDVALAIAGVGRDQRSVQRQHLQNPGDGGDFVRLGRGGDLSQDHASLTTPGADHAQRRSGVLRVERPPHQLAVDRDHAAGRTADPRRELAEAGAELVRVETAKHATEGIVTWHTVLQLQESAEKILLGFGEASHVHHGLPAGKNRTKGDRQDLQQVVTPRDASARILEIGKVLLEPSHCFLRRW